MVKIIPGILLSLLLVVTGCKSTLGDNAELDDNQREYILDKVNNYRGLIKLYRDKLNRKEDAQTRYKLAEFYYQVEDYESSRHFLQPLLASRPDEQTLLLESKNLLEMGKNAEALTVITRALQQNPESGEAYNIKGILLTQEGNYSAAHQAFNEARRRFVEEDIVINNLAMLAIMQEDYAAARDYLIPLYMRGQSNPKMLHNLVFVLVKLNDFSGAESILRQEKMSNDHDGLLESLAKVKPRPQQPAPQRSQERVRTMAPTTLAASAAAPTPANAASVPAPVMDNKTKPLSASPAVPVNSAITQENPLTPLPVLAQKKAAEEAMPAVAKSENASLAVTSRLKEVSAVRAGQHHKYFRMTLESLQAINFRELNSEEKNKRLFELYNVRLGQNLLQAGEKISRDNNSIHALTFYQKDTDTVLVEFEFKQPVEKTNIFRLPANKSSRERLVFDVYQG